MRLSHSDYPVRLQIRLTRSQAECLERMAKERLHWTSKAEMVRRLIDEHITHEDVTNAIYP